MLNGVAFYHIRKTLYGDNTVDKTKAARLDDTAMDKESDAAGEGTMVKVGHDPGDNLLDGVDEALRPDLLKDALPQLELNDAASQLRIFMKSGEGQDLLLAAHACLGEIESIAELCRKRAPKSTKKTIASVSLGNLATLVAPHAMAVEIVCGSALARIANALIQLGLDSSYAGRVAQNLAELEDQFQGWDMHLGALLKAAENAAGGLDKLESMMREIANHGLSAYASYAVHEGIDTHSEEFAANAKVVSFVFKTIVDEFDFDDDAYGNHSHSLASSINATSASTRSYQKPAAIGMFQFITGRFVIFGLVQAFQGLKDLKNAVSVAADSLDAQADALCFALRSMLSAACGTHAHRSIRLPRMLAVYVHHCELPAPAHRFGDSFLANHPYSAYFKLMLGNRTRITQCFEILPNQRTEVDRLVVFRFQSETSLALQSFDKRSVQSPLRGNPQMGSQQDIDLLWLDSSMAGTYLKTIDNNDVKIHLSLHLLHSI